MRRPLVSHHKGDAAQRQEGWRLRRMSLFCLICTWRTAPQKRPKMRSIFEYWRCRAKRATFQGRCSRRLWLLLLFPSKNRAGKGKGLLDAVLQCAVLGSILLHQVFRICLGCLLHCSIVCNHLVCDEHCNSNDGCPQAVFISLRRLGDIARLDNLPRHHKFLLPLIPCLVRVKLEAKRACKHRCRKVFGIVPCLVLCLSVWMVLAEIAVCPFVSRDRCSDGSGNQR